jgi:hypothetical protein
MYANVLFDVYSALYLQNERHIEWTTPTGTGASLRFSASSMVLSIRDEMTGSSTRENRTSSF